MTDATFNLFVYGTLQRRGSAAHLLQGCDYVGRGEVSGILYDMDGEFPALVLYGTEPVPGEVWRCPAHLLTRLDEYEQVSRGLFRRVAARVRLDHSSLPCWLYSAGPALARKLTPSRRVLLATRMEQSRMQTGGA